MAVVVEREDQMKTINDLKKEYSEVPVPEEGRQRMEEAVWRARADRRRMAGRRLLRRIPAAAAVFLFSMLVLGLNTNEAFARDMSEVPVFGAFARVLTVRSFEEQDRNVNVRVEMPGIQIAGDTADVDAKAGQTGVEQVNEEIRQALNQFVEDAKALTEEYREEYLATGGTEEEWEARGIEILTSYEVKSQTDSVLSLELICTESWASVYGDYLYYNVDLTTGEKITLKDMLGDRYQEIVDESVRRQIKERMAADENVTYWTEEDEKFGMNAFDGITEDTRFYINEAGNPVIVFEKYEIAPGYMGWPEFEITA